MNYGFRVSTKGWPYHYLQAWEKGDPLISWVLIDALVEHFQGCKEGSLSPHTELATEFFLALAGIRERVFDRERPNSNEPSPIPLTRDLAPALAVLGIVKKRGRPGGQRLEPKLAWQRVRELHDELLNGSELEQWAAQFFAELLRIRDASGDSVESTTLLKAFACLHLVQPLGHPKDEDQYAMAVFAKEELVRQELDELDGSSTAKAVRARIQDEYPPLTDLYLKNHRNKHKDLARIVSPGHHTKEQTWLITEELKALAGALDSDKSAE